VRFAGYMALHLCRVTYLKKCVTFWTTLYILQDTVLATDVNSVTTAGYQQRWRTKWIHLDLFLGVEQRIVG